MGFDSKGQFFPDTRVLTTGVYAQQGGVVSATTKAALTALRPALRSEGLEAVVLADNSHWVFRAASTAADTTSNLVLTPDAGDGRWLRTDKSVQLKMAIAFGTADAAVLFTVPAGMRLHVERIFWEISVSLTGGSSSAIGISSSQTGLTTKGSLQGDTAGDEAADLTAGIRPGALGTAFASNGVVVLEAASTIRFDRITSAFSAGTGFVHVLATQIS